MNLTKALEIFHLSDVGLRRRHNEDAITSDIENGLVVLADGMGGYKAGEVASEIAVMTIADELKELMREFQPGRVHPYSGMQLESLLMQKAVANANQAIYAVSQNQPQCAGMGTTLVMALFTNDRVLVGHIGDSRMYRLRDAAFDHLTMDHSLLQEQVKFGLITVEQAKASHHKNLVTRALGIDALVELELHEYAVSPGDLYLLCSDGLSDMVEDDQMHSVLSSLGENLQLTAEQLVQMANDHGGRDNISVILVRVLRPFPATEDWRQKVVNWLKVEKNGKTD